VQTVRYLAGLEARLAELADRVVAVRCAPAEIPAAFAPAYELLSLAHSDTEGRLFAS
jgi:urease accessory protein UreF